MGEKQAKGSLDYSSPTGLSQSSAGRGLFSLLRLKWIFDYQTNFYIWQTQNVADQHNSESPPVKH